jgi:hypothetical protein
VLRSRVPKAVKIAATELVQLLVCKPCHSPKCCSAGSSIEIASGPRIFGARAGPPRTIAAAVSWVRGRLLVYPDRVARGLLGEPGECGSLRAIARKAQSAIDPAPIAYWRVPHLPKTVRNLGHFAAAASSITISPIC